MKNIFTLLIITILNLQAMSKSIKTEIVINASAEKIWQILTDFEKYPSWNPFIKSIEGQAIVGKKIKAHIVPPQAKGMIFTPKVLVFETEKEFKWLGHLLFPGLFDGAHKFEIIDNHNGTCTFIQSEKFNGILVPLFKKMLDNNTVQGFELMNKALKERAEKK